MKLLIEIPKEFEQHFQADRFDDSLHRLSADAHLLAGLYEQEIALMLSESFKNAVPIPPHGRLLDTDEYQAKMRSAYDGDWFAVLADTPKVIPANGETACPPVEEKG